MADTQNHQPLFASGAFFTLSGPSVKLDPSRVPVRGDLAHIRLAGQVFVPHYIVPVAYRAKADTVVLKAAGGEAIADLAASTMFEVLDIAGGFAWGEIPGGEIPGDGVVGYVALDALEQVA